MINWRILQDPSNTHRHCFSNDDILSRSNRVRLERLLDGVKDELGELLDDATQLIGRLVVHHNVI